MTRTTWIAAAAGVAMASTASATWSIVIANKRTGEVAVGCSTCLEGFDLLQGTPVVLVGRGGASAQSSVDVGGYNRTIIRDQLLQNALPSAIINTVRTGDANANGRQYGIVSAGTFGAGATYTGTSAAVWAGGLTGSFGDYVYAVQGNILTGANVVSDARDALVNTPGDLPEKLMAAMEAARAGGGDGRCSCTTGAPTSCGSPPPAPFKSAHVGYMIVARSGDLDAGVAAYRASVSPQGVATGDLNLDGAPDVVAANSGANSVSIFRNALTAPSSRFLRLNTPTSSVFAGSPYGVALRDVTGDGRPDAFVTALNTNQVLARPANTAGGFGVQGAASVGAGPISLVLADLGGTPMPEVITANFTTGGVSVVPITSALPTAITLGAATTVTTGGQLYGIAAGDIDTDGDTDIVGADIVLPRLVRLINTAGVLAPGADIPLPGISGDVAAADLDGDSDTDLAAVCPADRSVVVLTNTAGVMTPVRTGLPFSPSKVRVADINSDGSPDLVILGSSSFAVFLSQGGVLADLTIYPGPPDAQTPQWSGLDLADMDRDGDLDIVVTQATSPGGVCLIENLGGSAGRAPGAFRAGVGLATGEYYLGLNVANANASDPDPVVTLHQQFDAWRAGLVGLPDAVHSTASAGGIVEPACPGSITVTLRDWQDQPIAAPFTVTAVHAGAAAPLLTIGATTQIAPGVYEVALTIANVPQSGEDELRVRVTGPGLPGPVLLMPTLRVRGLAHPLTDIDYNNDGLFPDTEDLTDYLRVYAGGACSMPNCDSIDFNADGIFPDALDFEDFLAVFAGRGCGA